MSLKTNVNIEGNQEFMVGFSSHTFETGISVFLQYVIHTLNIYKFLLALSTIKRPMHVNDDSVRRMFLCVCVRLSARSEDPKKTD